MTKRRERTAHLDSRASRVTRATLLLAATAIAFGGCSTMKETFGGWFGETPASAPTPREGQVYYASVEGLTMYSEPSSSSKVVAHLTQYEKVTRSRTEHGYALVRSDRTGVEGWVDNALLTWRIPAAKEKEAREKEPAKAREPGAAAAPAAAGGAATEPTPASTPEAAPAEAPPAAPAAAEAPAGPPATPSPSKPSPSMFDPF